MKIYEISASEHPISNFETVIKTRCFLIGKIIAKALRKNGYYVDVCCIKNKAKLEYCISYTPIRK